MAGKIVDGWLHHSRGILLAAIVFGLFVWVFDALMDYLFFYKGGYSFSELLFIKPPPHEIYVRSIILASFIVFGVLVSIHINRRRKAEHELRESRENLNITLNSIGDAVISTDVNGHIIRMNPIAAELTHWDPADAAGRPLTEVFNIVNALTREPAENPVQKVLESGKIVGLANHTVLIARNEREYQIADSAAPILNSNGIINGVVLVFRDVTEDYHKSRKIEENEAFLKAVFHGIKDGISVLNKDLTVRYVNPVMEKWYEKQLPLLGKKCYECYHQSDKPCEPCPTLRSIKSGKTEVDVVPGSKDPDSPVKWLELSSYPFTDIETGEVTGVIEFVRDITERKEAERKIEESEERFRLAYQANPDAIVITRISDGKYIDVNEGFTHITGYTREEVIGESSMSLNIWKNLDLRKEIGERIKKNQMVRNIESEFINKNGDTIHGLMSAALISLNEEPAVISITRDITKLKQTERELQEQRQRLELALKGAEIGLWDWNIQTGAVIFNERWAEMLGYRMEEIEPHVNSWKTLVHPDDVRPVMEILNAHLEGKTTYYETEHRARTKDGSWKWILDSGKVLEWDDDGNPMRAVGIHLDITERKEKEKLIQESEEKYRLLAETTSDIIVLHDMQGIITYANQALCDITGMHPDEVIGKPIVSFIPEDYLESFYQRQAKRRANDIQTYRYEAEVINMRGEHIPMDISSSPVIRDDVIDEVLVVARDISERIRAEQELKTKNEEYQATNEELSESLERIQEMNVKLEESKIKAEESDRLKSAFLANMSHEIRTPMNGILGFAELLKAQNLKSSKKKEYLNIIQESGKRMLNLINDLIDISKIEAGQMKLSFAKTNLNEVIDYQQTFFKPEASSKNIELTTSKTLPSVQASIETDREKLMAVLTNLIKNAIKFTNEGNITFGYNLKGNMVEFYVQDTGVGIPKEQQKAVFERFVHADLSLSKPYQGAGLGLSITKAYVHMMGGKIWVRSKEEEGSVFYFTIPYSKHEQNHESIDVSTDRLHRDLKNVTVLITEDDKAGSIYLYELLKMKCKKVMHAANGVEALELCQNNDDIDLILMDIKMPGMDGHEVTRRIREFNKNVIIVAQTAFALSGDREKAIEAGCDDYIPKPVKSDDLLRIMEKFF